MKNKKLIIGLVALVLVIAVMAGVYMSTRPETAAGSKTITVTVIHKDGTEKTFEYHTDEEFLGAVITAEGLVTGYEGEYGLVMESVDGETADWNVDQSYWAVYEGEEYAMQGIELTPIDETAEYRLVYAK